MRVLHGLGVASLILTGVPAILVGVLDAAQPAGQGLLCFGLVCLFAAAGAAASWRALRAGNPAPQLVDLDGEPALLLPRHRAPSRVASHLLLGYALVLLLGAGFAAAAGAVPVAGLLAAAAAGLTWTAAPGRDLAGGLWFTPTRVVHEHLGVKVELAWQDVTGAVDHDPMPILHRPDRQPRIVRTGPRGRAWNPVRHAGTLTVDTRHLAGGSLIASYVICKAVADPATRPALGTAQSLPPAHPGTA